MMKSFFKKLAFVMALAMVVTTAAPAAKSVYAADMKLAYQTGGAVTELNMKAGDQEDLRFLGAPANWKSLSMKWSSNNEAVATVDNNGVITAVKDGVAVITFALGDGTAASVTVNVGTAKTYDVTLGTADDKAMTATELKVGESIDLNFYGVKDWNRNNYVVGWFADSDAVTVDTKGIVTAVKAGTAVVTATIVNTATGVAHNVTPVTVTVPSEVVVPTFEVKQTAANKIVVTFDEEQTYTYEDFTVTEIFDTVSVDAPIKASEFVNATGTTVTIKMSANFDDGETYEVAFKNDTKATFVASVGKVTDVQFGYYTTAEYCDPVYDVAYVETADENNLVHLYPKFFDVNGVDVTDAVKAEDFSIEYTAVNDSDKYDVGYDEITFEAVGSAEIKMVATWYDEEGEEYTDEWIGKVVATKRPNLKVTYTAGAVFFENSKSATQTWSDVPGTYTNDFTNVAWGYAWSNNTGATEVVLDDTTVPVFVAMVSDNKQPSETWTTPSYTTKGEITYDSSNTNVFEIDPSTGEITAKKVGTAAVLVYFTANDTETPVLVGSTKVTVKAARYPASVTISDAQVKIANEGLDTGHTVKITVKDQYGDKIDLANGVADITVEATSTKNTTVLSATKKVNDTGVYEINFDAANFEKVTSSSASWSYNVTIDKTENPKLDKSKVAFSVRIYNVKEDMDKLEAKEDIKYAVSYEGDYWYNTVDVRVNDTTINFKNPNSKTKKPVKTQSINVYYVNKNGFKLAVADDLVPFAEGQTTGEAGKVYYTITAPTIKANTNPCNNATASALNNTIEWKFNTTDGTNFSAYATEGNYKVTLYTTRSESNSNIKKLGDYSITVENSQPDVIYGGYTWDYATRDNSHYNKFANIADLVASMDNSYTEDSDSAIIAAIYDCLSFSYNPEVDNWNYNQANNTKGYQHAKITSYVAKKVSNDKFAIKEVTFTITLPGTSETITQTVRVNASISR